MIAEEQKSRGASKRGLLAAGLLGYLAGSFPTADLVSKYVTGRRGGVGLREAGSGNPGAVNAATVLGRKWGLVVVAGDMVKGVAACVLGRAMGGDNGAYLAGTTAVAGHCYPVGSGFRGGGDFRQMRERMREMMESGEFDPEMFNQFRGERRGGGRRRTPE